MTKTQVQRIVREVAASQGAPLTRDEKWSVFTQVCDGLYRDARITLKQHDNWTSPFWPMLTQDDHDFVSFLFGKLIKHVDVDMLDLNDDDSCCDHLHFKQLELELWSGAY